jgi:ATP-dependent Clp protease ATP-binding subunit ClpC
MIHFSIGVQLAWEISSYEAANKRSSCIENDHIMLGILSLDKIAEKINNRKDINFEDFNYEKEKLYTTLITHQLNITSLRRHLRKAIPEGKGVPPDNIFHRSEECKQMFNSSSRLANNYIRINHLFISIIGLETSYTRDILIAENTDINKLKTDLLFSQYMKN